MSDTFTETTTKSWGQRLKESVAGIVIGLIMAGLCLGLLWWNEGRAINRTRTLAAGRSAVISIPANPVDPANQGKLVHFSGRAETAQTLEDPLFRFRRPALKLKRTVQMYQWKEDHETKTKTTTGGGETTETVYTYRKVWSEALIDSGRFRSRAGHENPASMPFQTQVWTASDIHVGAFFLSTALTERLDDYTGLTPTAEDTGAMESSLTRRFKLSGGEYLTGDLSSPGIGDLRVHFSMIEPQDISVIGGQSSGNRLEPWRTPHGSLDLLSTGTRTPDEMFSSAEMENTLMTWLIRLGGFVGVWAGLGLFFRPFRILADVVPFIGSIVGVGIGFVAGSLAFAASLVTIAAAWIYYRPVFGYTLLGIAAALVVIFLLVLRRRKQPGDGQIPVVR
ncbi:MAG: TMEM43 family protein [Pseudomonadota bacterium]|nr:TMEM43 family protein [Pseudomonadota bacterium]